MEKYNQRDFANALVARMRGRDIPNCPYCGGQKFTTTEQFATILTGDDLGSINIGPSVPSGMLVCENCGHIEFFALGALGLLTRTEEKGDGK